MNNSLKQDIGIKATNFGLHIDMYVRKIGTKTQC